jgi:Cdc6-like AAA superfamily ATPase
MTALNDYLEETEEPTLDTTIPQRIVARMYYKDDKMLDEVIALAKKHIIEDKDRAKISLVISTRVGLSTIPQDIKNTNIDIAANYGNKFMKVHDKIVEKLNDPLGKGLVLLHGVPGTGKTSYIRHLCKEIKKEIIFLPPFLAENIAGPDFIPFLLDHTNSILIIEDAEKVVLDREGDGSNRQSVANLLNMTDGILSDCLSIQIVATFNTTRERIDKALLRKGRLIAEWKFEALDVDHSNRLLKTLGKEYVTDAPMILTDIYNLEEELNVVQKDLGKIGFKNY